MKYKVTDENGNVTVVATRQEAWEVAESQDGNSEIDIIFDFER